MLLPLPAFVLLMTLGAVTGASTVHAQTPVPAGPTPLPASLITTANAGKPLLRGLLVVGQDPSKPAVLAPVGAPTAAAPPREVCREPASGPSQPRLAEQDVAVLRRELDQLPVSAPVIERIRSTVPQQVLNSRLLTERLAAFIGRPLDGAVTKAVIDETVSLLKEDGRYLVDVYFPEQASADGIAIMVVRPALLGQVTAKGQQFYEAREITCRIRLQPDQPVDLRVLAEDLAQLNSSSSWRYTAAPEFVPGQVPGTTDLILNTTDEKPLRYFFGGDNTGSPLTGMGRYRAGVNVGNFLGRFDHQLDYTLTSSGQYHGFNQHSLAYQMPLEGRERLTARLDLAQSDTFLEHRLFRSQGDNQIASLEWARPQARNALQDSQRSAGADTAIGLQNLTSETALGLEYKRIGNSLAFNQVVVSDRAPQVLQAYGAWRSAWQDSLGASQLYTRLTLSPGSLLSENDRATFNAVRPGASPSYWRLNAAFNRQVELPSQWSLGVNLNAQLANKALISSERIQLSGVGGVRGYYSSTLVADAGATASFEVQSPRQPFELAGQTGNWYALAFVDAGRSWNATPEHNADLDSTGRQFNLVSHGVGVRVETSSHSHFRLDLTKRHFGLHKEQSWLWHGSWQVAF